VTAGCGQAHCADYRGQQLGDLCGKRVRGLNLYAVEGVPPAALKLHRRF